MENISILFQISFSEIVALMVALMIIWIVVMGYQLYVVFREENPNGELEDWAKTSIGKKYLKVALTPLVPLVVCFVILCFPIVLCYTTLQEWLGKRKK